MSLLPASRKTLLIIFAIAFPLNFAWEMLQMFAYAPFAQSAAQTWLICGLASLVDATYILGLYAFGKVFTRNDRWMTHLTWKRIVMIATIGIISATIMERIALTLELWKYSDAMIRVPVLQVGIIPLLQLSILPLLTFWLVKQTLK